MSIQCAFSVLFIRPESHHCLTEPTQELTDSLMLLRLINVTLAVEDASSNLVADVDVCVEESVADSSAAA